MPILLQVLEACSKCYECLCYEEYAIAGKCDVARKTLIDSLVVKFKEAMQDFFAEVYMSTIMVLLLIPGLLIKGLLHLPCFVEIESCNIHVEKNP